MIKKSGYPHEEIQYTVYKDNKCIVDGTFIAEEKGKTDLPYSHRKDLPPNITVELIRENGEKDSYS